MDKKYITINCFGVGASQRGTTHSGGIWMATSARLTCLKDELLKHMKRDWKNTLEGNCMCTKEYRYYIGVTIKYKGQSTKFMNIKIDPKEL